MLSHHLIVLGFALVLVGACSSSGDGTTQNASGSASLAGATNAAGTTSGAGGASSAGSSGATTAGATSVAGTAGANAAGAGGGAGGGGVSGGGGGGGGGGSAIGPVKPVLRGDKWAFDMGEVTLEVDPKNGGRISAFKLGTENLLTDATVNPTYWGSTLWISPEATLWMQPPPAPIDSDPYSAVATDTSVTLTGMAYTSAKLSASATKTITADPALGAFKIEYKVTNTAQAAISLAPWEVTRVFPRGLTFFPTGSTQSLSTGATLPTTNTGGITWFAYDMNAVTKDSKLYADALEGWVAHVAVGLVFIKSFGDVTADKLAPKEGDVELYTNALHTYVEMEDQGPYVALAPGASTSWTVTWFLRKLPAGVEATAGNAALATFVRDTIAGK